jgi:2-deoxy-D-gluconate 3-dehydrogenase
MSTRSIAELLDLKGKGAIVTGAGMGIGQAIAFRLAEAGAAVTITDINLEAANQTAEQIVSRGGTAQAIQANASSSNDARRATKATVKAFGSLDILVNNAGIFPHASVLDISEKMWDEVLGINIKGVYFNSQAAAKEMIKAGRGGKIVNMASMEGLHPRKDLGHYVTTKAGVIILTKSLALELAPHNILVNAIAPGGILTPGTVAQRAALKSSGKSLKELYDNYMSRLPLGRMGEPDDVAKVVLFMVSSAANYMTGSVILVDGGYLLS